MRLSLAVCAVVAVVASALLALVAPKTFSCQRPSLCIFIAISGPIAFCSTAATLAAMVASPER